MNLFLPGKSVRTRLSMWMRFPAESFKSKPPSVTPPILLKSVLNKSNNVGCGVSGCAGIDGGAVFCRDVICFEGSGTLLCCDVRVGGGICDSGGFVATEGCSFWYCSMTGLYVDATITTTTADESTIRTMALRWFV